MISQVGFPYQYDQGPLMASRLFLAGFALRLLMAKTLGRLPLVGQLFSQPAAFEVIEGKPYVAAWRRTERTTRVLQAATAAAMLVGLARRLIRPM